jgi:large subunit ribosomal protein L30
MKEVLVSQVRSSIGVTPTQKKTLIALGLKKKGSSREHKLTPQIQGMIRSVNHLVEVTDKTNSK